MPVTYNPSMTTPARMGETLTVYDKGWPAREHAEAMTCRDVEGQLRMGLAAYREIEATARGLAMTLVQMGTGYDRASALAVEAMLHFWLRTTEVALACIAYNEGRGFDVQGAIEYRQAVRDARVGVSISVERAAAVSDRIAREGLTGTLTTEDLRRERLRRRLGA